MRTRIILAIAFVALSPAAFANGCNGVVSQLEWGCAAWDNNNGPQFPHYNKALAAQPVRPGNAALPSKSRVISDNGLGIVHPPTGSGR
jgi:hypothetical protein